MILIVGYMSEAELKELGKIIRLKRESQSLTQIELAQKSGLDRNYIGMVERGERNPSYMSLQKIAHGLGLTVDQMIKP
jgi:transcriptional regulator with XRE-family HTH domain